MANNIETKYGTANQVITCTLTSLASSATVGREAANVDNTTNLFLDALLVVKFKVANTAPANDQRLYVYGGGTVDGGTTFSAGLTGTDASYTMQSPTSLRLIGTVPTPTQNISYIGGPWRVSNAFGGALPAKWNVFILNFTGMALTGTASDHVITYQGVLAQSV